MKKLRMLLFTLGLMFLGMSNVNPASCFYIGDDGEPVINCASGNCGCCLQWWIDDVCYWTGYATDFCACYGGGNEE